MNAQREPAQEQNIPVSPQHEQTSPGGEQVTFEDNRPAGILQRKLMASMASPPADEETAQLRSSMTTGAGRPTQASPSTGSSGIPAPLRTGLERLSGFAMDDVKVHYNSDKPAQLQAHAYAQGTDIHLAPGQEKQLPHEAWHVVQQKQNRVKPTRQLKSKIPLNDDAGLEKEADVMGAKALQVPEASPGTPSLKKASVNAGNVQRRLKVADNMGQTLTDRTEILDRLYTAYGIERKIVVENCIDVEEKNQLLWVSENLFYKESVFKEAVGRLIDSPVYRGEIFLNPSGREGSYETHVIALGHQIRKEIARWRIVNSKDYNEFLKWDRFKNQADKDDLRQDYILTKSRLRAEWDMEEAAVLEKEKAHAVYKEKVAEEIMGGVDETAAPKIYKTALLGAGSSIAYYIKSQQPDPEETLLIGTAQPWKTERGGEGNVNHPPHQLMIQERVEENQKYPDSQNSLTKRKDFTQYIEEVIAPFQPKEILVTKISKKGAGDDFFYEIEAGGETFYAQNVVYGIGAGKHRPPGFVDAPGGGTKGLDDAEVFFATKNGWPFRRVMDMDLFQNFLIENDAKEDGNINLGTLEVIVIGPNAAIDVVTACLREGVGKVKWMAGGGVPLFLEGTDNLVASQEYKRALKGESNILEVINERAARVDPKGEGDKPEVYGVRNTKFKADLVVYGIGQDGRPIDNLLPEGVNFGLKYDKGLHFNEEPDDSLAFEPEESNGEGGLLTKEEADKLLAILNRENLMQTAPMLALDAHPAFNMSKAKLLPTVTGLVAEKASESDTTSFEIVGATANSILRSRNIPNQYFFIDEVADGLAKGTLSPLVDEFKQEFRKVRERIPRLNHLVGNLRRARDKDAAEMEIENVLGDIYLIMDQSLGGIIQRMRLAANAEENVKINWLEKMLLEIRENLRHSTGAAELAKIAKTLPANVLTQDQLHTIMAMEMAKGERGVFKNLENIDLVADNRTQIVKFITHSARYLPASVVNLIAQKIQIDRRNRPTDSAPLPEMVDPITFHLDKKRAFEKNWHDLIERMNGIAKQMIADRD